jgi:hypothetical protein
MARVETWFSQDLKQAVKVHYIDGNVFSQDNNGNVVGVEVFDNGTAATLSGTVSGSAIRADGATVALTGTRSGNKCSVVLPQTAYYVPGVISIVIKLTSGEDVTTLCAVVGNVYASSTDTIVDPGTIIPSIESLIASIDAAVDSIPLDYSALSNGFRDAMETEYGLSDPGTFTAGTIKKTDGTVTSSTAFKITDYIPVTGGTVIYTTTPATNSTVLNERVSIAFYSSASTSGYISGADVQSGDQTIIIWQTTNIPSGAKYFRIMIGKDLTAQFKCIQVKPDSQTLAINSQFTGLMDLSGVTFEQGKYISNFTDGTISTNAGFMLSDFIEIPGTVGSVTVNRNVYYNGTVYQQGHMVGFYDSSKNYLNSGSVLSSGAMQTVLITDKSSKYMRVNFSAAGIVPFIMTNAKNCFGGYPVPLQTVTNFATLNDLPFNNIYVITGTNEISNKPYDSFTGIIFALSHTGGFNAGGQQIAIDHLTKDIYIRDYWGSPASWGKWFRKSAGYVNRYTGQFPGNTSPVNTAVYLLKNTTYLIRFNKPRTQYVNVYLSNDTSNYKRLEPWENDIFFTTGSASGTLMVYSSESTDQIDFDVYQKESYEAKANEVPMKYVVSKVAAEADFTSFTACLLALKDDERPKIIEIWEGDYDIYQEYVDANVPVYTGDNPSLDYFNYCVWIPANTHIIGKGIVRLKWMPDPATDPITAVQCQCVSPVNVAGTMTLENVEIHCKNGRYCIHNDPKGMLEYSGAVQTFKNVICYKYPNDRDSSNVSYGFTHTTGFGIDRAQHHVYENCIFHNTAGGRSLYGHTRYFSTLTNENRNSNITVTNCVMETNGNDSVFLGNVAGSYLHVRVFFAGCYLSGKLRLVDSSSTGTPKPNAFDVSMLDCGDVTAEILDPDNPYPIKAYRTNLTIV